MRFFNDRKISTKLAIGFACVLAITLTISAVAYLAFVKVKAGVASVNLQAANSARAVAVDRNFLYVRWQAREFGLTGEQKFADGAKQALVTLMDSVKDAEASLINPERKQKMIEVDKEAAAYKKMFDRVVELRQAEAAHIKEVLDPSGTRLRVDFEKLQALAAKAGNSNLLTLAGQGLQLVMQARLNVNKVLARHEQAAADSAAKAFAGLKIVMAALDGAATDADSRRLATEVKSLVDKYSDAYAKASAEAHEIETLLNVEMAAISTQIAAAVNEVKKAAQDLAAQEEHAAEALIDGVEFLILVMAAGGLALGIVFAWLIGRGIANPIAELRVPLENVAGGNFTVTVPGTERKDEVGLIAGSVQTMVQKMSHAIAEIKASGREVTNASVEISTATTDLSQRTEEQAASLEQTSAAMEELAATVRRNAENAQLANQDAAATREVADRGGAVVAQAVDAMAKIEESSRKISDIIGVIDEIARQTNLLALNAAVEAARAGEAGRGFAVVASEVRSLAQRSSQAAKDIKDLITNSNGQVKDGVELVNRAGGSLTEIVDSIKKVVVVVSAIANASAEQATGIDQINKALTQMDDVTQQNSALVEENAATAKTLEHQAKAMDEQVSVFQIAGGRETQSYAPASAVPTPRPAFAKPLTRPSAGPAREMQPKLKTAVGQEWSEF